MRQEQIDRLTELQDANGRLTPEAVVTDARDPQSPLHELFNWDVEKAAEGFWLDRARSIIRSVEVVIKTHRTVVRTPYYVRDPEAEQKEQGYVSITKVRSEPDLARDVLVAEFSRAADILRRAHEVSKALELEERVSEILEGVMDLRNEIMEPPTQRM